MKTATIKTPTAELMIVELHERTADFIVMNTGDRLAVCAFDENDYCLDIKGISKDYTLLGKPDEISEEDAEEIVQKAEYDFGTYYRHYSDKTVFAKTATESLLSILESEIYWDMNPLGKGEPVENLQSSTFGGEKTIIQRNPMNILWHEAEQKTFDRNRTLIFVEK